VWEKREDFANLVSFVTQRKGGRGIDLRSGEGGQESQTNRVSIRPTLLPPCSRIEGVELKLRDNNGELVSPVSHHDTVVRPRSTLRRFWHKSIGRWPGSKSAIVIGRRNECDLLAHCHPVSTYRHVLECISVSACYSSPMIFQVVPPA
jgi:hypothetical protein